MSKIESVFAIIDLEIKKARRGFIKHSQKETAINSACRELFREYLEVFKTARQLPDGLRPFEKTVTVTFTAGVSDSNLATIDPEYFETISFLASGRKGQVIYDDDEWADIKGSFVIAPTADFPALKQTSTALNVLPASITSADVNYIFMPLHTTPANGTAWFEITTTPSTRGEPITGVSVDLRFIETDVERIAYKALLLLGIPVQDNLSQQIAIAKDNGSKPK